MRQTLKLLLLLVTALFGLPPNAGTQDTKLSATSSKPLGTTPLKVMCLGDSITAGSGGTGGSYRKQLQRLLTKAGYTFDFVGRSSDSAVAWDPQHEGRGGLRTEKALSYANAALTANPNPDLILLLIGINSLIENRNAVSQALTSYDNLLAGIKANPNASNAWIIVSTLIPNRADDPQRPYDPNATYVNSEAKVLEFNRRLPSEVLAHYTRVSLVDNHSALTARDLADGIHPNQGGYDKMASVWLAGVQSRGFHFYENKHAN